MEPFTKLTTIAVPMPAPNIDTDQIMPTRFLRKKRSEGYHNWVFYDKRFQTDGAENPEFILNREPYRSAAKILVAGDNFGCGSSREGAVWGLTGFGFRALIAPSFGDILFNNSLQNGLLPIVLPRDAVARLLQQLLDNPGAMITVDLQAQTVTGMDGASYTFAVDPFRKQCLLTGKDEIGVTLDYMPQIQDWEQRSQKAQPWLLAVERN